MKQLALDEIKTVLRAEMKTPKTPGLISRVTTDSRDVLPGDMFVALRGPRFNGHDFIDQAVERGAVAVVADMNLPVSAVLKERGTTMFKVEDSTLALGDLARFYRQSLRHSLTVIAVTGSNGKTTTREMIYHVLSKRWAGHRSPASYNNQIGLPMTLLGVEPIHHFAVVEIGSSAPGEIANLSRIASPDIAVITHIGPAHLAGFGDIDGVSIEKSSIVAGLKERGVVVCHAGHTPTLERVRSLTRHVISFGTEGDVDVSAGKVRVEHGRLRFETNDRCEIIIPIGGAHNANNALAALAVVRRLGITTREFAAAITDFSGVSGRMRYLSFGGITVIDDTYNANPDSMAAAIAELTTHRQAPRRVLIIGDMAELGPHSEQLHRQLGRDVAFSNIDALLTVGPQAAHAARAALDAGMGRGSVQRAVSSTRLARLVKTLILDGDVILVKGSRSVKMETVVTSLSRWRGIGGTDEIDAVNRTGHFGQASSTGRIPRPTDTTGTPRPTSTIRTETIREIMPQAPRRANVKKLDRRVDQT